MLLIYSMAHIRVKGCAGQGGAGNGFGGRGGWKLGPEASSLSRTAVPEASTSKLVFADIPWASLPSHCPASDCSFLKADSDGVPAASGRVREVSSTKDTDSGVKLRLVITSLPVECVSRDKPNTVRRTNRDTRRLSAFSTEATQKNVASRHAAGI